VLSSEHTILLRKRRKQKLEAVKFWRKRFDKISWKRKRTWKRPTLCGAESGSELGSMTLQEELEAETKNILLLPHLWLLQSYSHWSKSWFKPKHNNVFGLTVNARASYAGGREFVSRRPVKSYTAFQTVRHRFNIYAGSCFALALWRGDGHR